MDIRSLDDSLDSTLNHCVQVAVLSAGVGRLLGLGNKALAELAMAALLHDTGKILIPPEVFFKPGKLTPEEREIMERQSEIGRDVLVRTKTFGPRVANAVIQHHERFDGSGYPVGLVGKKIGRYASIIAVCDVLEAMTAPRRYKPSVHPRDTLDHLRHYRGRLYDTSVVDAVAKMVAPYPVGCTVILSSGIKAVVTRINPHALDRPVVCSVSESESETHPREHDLSSLTDLHIVEHRPLGF